MSQRQQIKRALRDRDRAEAAAAFGRSVRLATAGQLVHGQIAQPVAEAWLQRRQADRAAAPLVIVDDPAFTDAGKTCPECNGKGRAPHYPEQASRYCPACDYDEADTAPTGKTCPEASDAPCSLTDADPGCCARDHQ